MPLVAFHADIVLRDPVNKKEPFAEKRVSDLHYEPETRMFRYVADKERLREHIEWVPREMVYCIVEVP